MKSMSISPQRASNGLTQRYKPEKNHIEFKRASNSSQVAENNRNLISLLRSSHELIVNSVKNKFMN